MKKDIKFYLKLFFSTLQISAFTFGGGFVIASLMKKKFVDQFKWLDEDEMLDYIAIAQSSPGAIAVNASVLAGYGIAGIPGAAITIVATVIPPFVVISIISFFYIQFRDSILIQHLLQGMQAGVAAVIFDVVIGMAISILGNQKKIICAAIMLCAFLAVAVFEINVVIVIIICGILGAFIFSEQGVGKEHKGK